jgi:hypothetical protein
LSTSVLSRLLGLSSRLASAAMPQLTELTFDMPNPSREIVRDTSYFGLTLNQLNLAHGREWFSEYDPLVYVAADFLYGKERVSIPKLIGPTAIKLGDADADKHVPHGTLVTDIRVAGPNPYRGEQIGITLILFKVQTNDYAKRVLRIAQGLSDAIGIAGIATAVKIGGPVVDGIEAIFGMDGTQPVLGHRVELAASPLDGLRERSTALVGATDKPCTGLNVVGNRLLDAAGAQYSGSDFVLYSLWSLPSRQGERSLPFYAQVEKMYEAASAGDDASWERAKAALITVYQQMLISADLTRVEADQLFDSYKAQIVDMRAKRMEVTKMGAKEVGRQQNVYREQVEQKIVNQRMNEIMALRL